MLLAADADEAYAKIDSASVVVPADKSAACPIVLPVVCAILCSLPFGIAAMLFSLRGRAAFAEGDFVRAERAKRRSVLFSRAAIVWAVLMILVYLILTTG